MKKVFLLMLCFAMTASAVLLQNGDSIAFLGDSITEHGILDRGNDEVVYDECEDVSDQYEEIPDGE